MDKISVVQCCVWLCDWTLCSYWLYTDTVCQHKDEPFDWCAKKTSSDNFVNPTYKDNIKPKKTKTAEKAKPHPLAEMS